MRKPEFLKKVRRAHFTGLKGVGMTALACCFQDLGIKVGGSDVDEVFVTDKVLNKRKIRWRSGFNPDHLKPRPDLVIYSGAHGGLANPEVVAAGELRIPLVSHAEALGKIMEGKEGISVCGVGGKTTTCSMMAMVLSQANRQPSYAIGVAEIYPLGPGGKYQEGREFVAEADEYATSPGIDNRPRFLFQHPKNIILTNIEFDHPDIYRNLEQTKQTFMNFFESLPSDGMLLISADNPNHQDIFSKLTFKNIQTYGFSPKADWHVEKSYMGAGQTIFSLSFRGMVVEDIILKVPGKHNILNATAVFALGTSLGLDPRRIKEGLEEFAGTRRRFEFVAEANGVKVYDDYAHHPQEISATLVAAKKWFPHNRLLVIFQPHTFSRTKALLPDFARSFSQADMVIVPDIYASARETDDLGINSRLLTLEIQKYNHNVFYKPGKDEVKDFIGQQTKPGDIVLTLGAGNIFQWHKDIIQAVKQALKQR